MLKKERNQKKPIRSADRQKVWHLNDAIEEVPGENGIFSKINANAQLLPNNQETN